MIRFDSNDDLPLGVTIKIRSLAIVVRSVLKNDNEFYPQIFWIVACMKCKRCWNMIELTFQKVLTLKNLKKRRENAFFASFGI